MLAMNVMFSRTMPRSATKLESHHQSCSRFLCPGDVLIRLVYDPLLFSETVEHFLQRVEPE